MRFQKQSKAAVRITIVLSVILCFGATCVGAYAANSGQNQTMIQGTQISSPYNSRTNSLIQNFKKYKAYGITYNPDQDAVYYHGKRVKIFVVFQSGKDSNRNYAFDLCYQDGQSSSKLYLEAFKDQNGNIKIQKLNADIAEELLETMTETAPNNPLPSDSNELTYYNMDATQIIEKYKVTAQDFAKTKASASIQKWIKQCDNKKGAYKKTIKTANGYTTYLYYNGGGRYPWKMKISNQMVTVSMFSNSNLATKDGYYLMRYTAPKEYSTIRLSLDGESIPFTK